MEKEASEELEKVAEKAATEGDKDGILNKTIKEAVDGSKSYFKCIKKGHLDSLGAVGDGNVVGDAASDSSGAKEGTAPDDGLLKKAYNALKGIVDEAVKEGVEKPEIGNTAVKIGSGTDNKDGAKILATVSGGKPGASDAGKAAAMLTTVSGKEILAAIVNSQEGDASTGVSSDADGNTSAMSFAKGGTAAHVSNSDQAKAGAVSGGIALRALVKDGKLGTGAADSAAGGGKEVQGVGITAVNKLLVAVEDVVKKTVKNILEKTKIKIDEARKPKTVNNE